MPKSVLFLSLVLVALGVNTACGSSIERRSLRAGLSDKVSQGKVVVKEEPTEFEPINSDRGHAIELQAGDTSSSISELPDRPLNPPSSVPEMRERLEQWESSRFLPHELLRAMEASSETDRKVHLTNALDFIRHQFHSVTDLQTAQKVFDALREVLLPEIYHSEPSTLEKWVKVLEDAEKTLNHEVVKDPGRFFLALVQGLSQAKKALREAGDSSTSGVKQLTSKKRPVSSIEEDQAPGSKKHKSSSVGKEPEVEESITSEKLQAYAESLTKESGVKQHEPKKQDQVHPLTYGKILSYAMTKTPAAERDDFEHTLRYGNLARVIIADSQLFLWMKMGFEKKADMEEVSKNMAAYVERIYMTSYKSASPYLTWGKPEHVFLNDADALTDSEYHRVDEAQNDAKNRIKSIFSWFLPEMALSKMDYYSIMAGMLSALERTSNVNQEEVTSANKVLMNGIPHDLDKIIEEFDLQARSREPLYRKLENLKKLEVEKNKALVTKNPQEAKLHLRALDILVTAFKMQIQTEGNDDITKILKLEFDGLHRIFGTASKASDVDKLHKIVEKILDHAKTSASVNESFLKHVKVTLDFLGARTTFKLKSAIGLA